MVSDFRKKKLLEVFHFFDTNKSGSIDKQDFQLAIEKIAKIRGWGASDAKFKELETTLTKVWEGIQSKADKDKDGTVSADEWIALWDEFAQNPAAAFDWQTLYSKFIFSLQDASNDGSIDSDEFASVNSCFGVTKEQAQAAFQKMAKGKASISWAEFRVLWKEYFTSEDQTAAGNFIFGKSW